MLKYTLFFTLFLSFTLSLQAQKPAPAEKSDPEAKKVLDRIRKKYEGYKSVEAAFTLTIEIADQPKEVQKGIVNQDGDKFRLDMDQQVIASDGKTTWVYLKKNNEIQITDTDPNDENGFLTPKDLLSRYQKGDFLYAIIDKVSEKGRVLTQIEFKPKSKSSEYAKIRVSINEKAGTIESIKAIAKDASRYTFQITKLTPNKTYPAGFFQLKSSDYPGVHVEDLRM
ncbi:MAG: outer membrane lipoprotein carrier protein LolA [Lewinellaceae bacterium]|nr:outer membrane lipoprotein carrier protein LolA [Saprospiraceae bacterium]MCB9331028.1 outer membrane lipoprotein carrier protein LolA [Lewinellaceae bacterium]